MYRIKTKTDDCFEKMIIKLIHHADSMLFKPAIFDLSLLNCNQRCAILKF